MPLQRAGYSNIKQSLTLKKKNFELSKKCSNFNIFDDFALSLSNACFGPKSAKTRCLEKFTHSHFAENRQVKSKTTEFGKKLLKAHARFQRDGNCNFEKITNFRKKRFRKKFFENFKFFSMFTV